MSMPLEFQDRVAVVTGAAKGLGRAIAGLLCERGAQVVLVDIDNELLRKTTAELQEQGKQASCLMADVSNEDELAALREHIQNKHRRLDILVNNAGGWRYGAARDITLSDWEWTFKTNVTGAFLTSRVLMDFMIDQRYGRIVNIASTDAYRAKPTLPHYAAAKAAVVSLTRSLAFELAPHEVIVNAVSPGPIATETAKSQGWLEERLKTIPLGRIAEPVDIAEVVLFLASDRNRYVVGETIMANGGSLMR
jgi:3-oxoacyl-[acyl-carrier protein] reductase